MADKGRGGGRRTFNRGRRCGFGLGAPITTNPFTFSIHISTLESMIHVIVLTPNTLPTTQDQPNPTFVRESIPTTPEEYQHCRDEILQHSTEEGTSTQDSPNTATFVNDNEIYLNAVGGPNYKRNVYMLGTLSKRFSCSKSAPSTSIAPVEDQIEEMRETINKLNVELLEKANKEKTLEEKMLQLMENHDHQSQDMRQPMQEQSEQIHQQNELMQSWKHAIDKFEMSRLACYEYVRQEESSTVAKQVLRYSRKNKRRRSNS
ncbi:hypothetical protein JHK85_004895 [Glycine max]|nr:hypothetical protein JHK85_004895 [Glycine max]